MTVVRRAGVLAERSKLLDVYVNVGMMSQNYQG